MKILKNKIKLIKKKYYNIKRQILNDDNNFVYNKNNISLYKEYYDLKKILNIYKNYLYEINHLKEAEDMLKTEIDKDMIKLIELEKKRYIQNINTLENQINKLLINDKKDISNNKNAIIELRTGTGGDEAAIFVGDILRMYIMFFKLEGWKYNVINSQPNISNHGYKEVILSVMGNNAYKYLKFESGVHRVQRIPKTESQGRLHTSAVSVVVLPEAEEIDVKINPEDIKRDTFRSRGAGGQNVNKIESAVRLTHLPTNIVVECQEERSQHKNLEKAMIVLRSKLYSLKMNRLLDNRANTRKLFISTGDRSVKIRTYNFPQGRVTDHRIKKTFYNLESFLNGNIKNMINLLRIHFSQSKIK